MRMSRLSSSAAALSVIATLSSAPRIVPAQQSGTPGAAAARGFPSDAEILAILKQRVEEKRSAGIVVGILEAGGHTRIIAYGDPGPGQPPLDGSSVFEIGSISKVFTATVLAELVQQGVRQARRSRSEVRAGQRASPDARRKTDHAREFVRAELRPASHADELPSQGSVQSLRRLHGRADVRVPRRLRAHARPRPAIRVLESRRRAARERAGQRDETVVRGDGARARLEAARNDEHRDHVHAVDEAAPRARTRRDREGRIELGHPGARRRGRHSLDDRRHAQVRRRQPPSRARHAGARDGRSRTSRERPRARAR